MLLRHDCIVFFAFQNFNYFIGMGRDGTSPRHVAKTKNKLFLLQVDGSWLAGVV